MTLQTPVFNVSEFELRNFTNPYLTPDQATEVSLTEDRVNGQLDFLAQMLGWNGPNYWGDLASTVDQKRQLLGGTFGVYNSFLIPRVYEFRNWDNTIVVDRVPFLVPNRSTQVARLLLDEDVYTIQSVTTEGDKYVVSIGELSDEFFVKVANGAPLRVDVPTYRPAPFYRDKIGASGDYSFVCGYAGETLTLYPAWDTQKSFSFKFSTLFAGSVYYFDQPIYLSLEEGLSPYLLPTYNSDQGLWYIQIPSDIADTVGFTAYLAWAHTGATEADNASLEVLIQPWANPSDWSDFNVLDNFRGVWGNKGGVLPFNFVFDSLSLHGFDEAQSVVLDPIKRSLQFNEIVNYVYYQKTTISEISPPAPDPGDLWWNSDTGVLSVWLDNNLCGNWVEIEYRQSPRQLPPGAIHFDDVLEFRAAIGSLSDNAVVQINNIFGLNFSDNIVGVQGTIQSTGVVVLLREGNTSYWTPLEFTFFNEAQFAKDALLLPYGTPVTISDSTGLSPSGLTYKVSNLPITITGDYDVILRKHYSNDNWEIYPDSILKYIAYSALFGSSPEEGEMWWEFVNSDPNSRATAIRYQEEWVGVNTFWQTATPAPTLDLGVVLFYSDGVLLEDGVAYTTDDYIVSYTSNPAEGAYEFSYTPRTFKGKVQLPAITISDSLTTTYRADITELTYSGARYYLSPNVYNAETPLRLWKAEALQVAETVAHLNENNYSNPLLADLNSGPGPENWEKYFVRLPLEYGRDDAAWQKVSLVCQNFAYWGSSLDPEKMKCPPEDDLPAIYEELFLYNEPIPDYTYVYSEPYLYSNVAYFNVVEPGVYQDSGVFPASDIQFDEFSEAELITYDPLHNRQADVTSPVNEGYGEWVGQYVNISPCTELTGHLTTDLLTEAVTPVAAPVWDASIYKFAPTCESAAASYNVDANHYKVGYAYFVADASAAEDAFFDISKEASWRYPVNQSKTSDLTPR